MQQDEVISILEKYHSELDAILSRFIKTRDDIHIDRSDDPRFRQLALEIGDFFVDALDNGKRYQQQAAIFFNESISNYSETPSYQGVENFKGLVASVLSRVRRNPLAIKTAAHSAKQQGVKDPDILITLAQRLHAVIRQLRERREERHTLDVTDEYDLQDLFHALLQLFFDDIRKEEWTPSYAGGASRMDFLLPEIEAVVELKMMRSSQTTRRVGEELTIDKAKYQVHPNCRTLFCIVYDPEGRISNPRGLEKDLSEITERMTTVAMIVPK